MNILILSNTTVSETLNEYKDSVYLNCSMLDEIDIEFLNLKNKTIILADTKHLKNILVFKLMAKFCNQKVEEVIIIT